MTAAENQRWQTIQDEVLRRIHSREWKPGELIPNEVALAEEFSCARATVNRALRNLAEAGLLDRRRKAGTRIALQPVRKATLNIPVIRQEIMQRQQRYGYALISCETKSPPADILARMQLQSDANTLHIIALHLADNKPYVYENRWLNIDSVPAIVNVDLSTQSANEWLVTHAPFTHGDISFSATNATPQDAEILSTQPDIALFLIERSTWNQQTSITSVRLTFAPGYRMHTII